MSEENAQLSVPISQENLANLNIWCKLNKKTQPQAIAKLIEDHIPNYKIHFEKV